MEKEKKNIYIYIYVHKMVTEYMFNGSLHHYFTVITKVSIKLNMQYIQIILSNFGDWFIV